MPDLIHQLQGLNPPQKVDKFAGSKTGSDPAFCRLVDKSFNVCCGDSILTLPAIPAVFSPLRLLLS